MLAAAGPAGHLRQQLEGALRGAEVRQAEPDVGADDADQRDARKVVSLGDHLRADEHVELPRGEPREQRRDRAAPADGVAIDAADARRGEERAHLRLDPLGAEAELLEVRAGALARTTFGSGVE